MLLVQQAPGEVVDWSDGTERHGVVSPPEQVGAEHHRQVAVGHLIHFAVGRYLETDVVMWLISKDCGDELVGTSDTSAVPSPET